MSKETGPMTPEEFSKLTRLMAQPTASAAALASLTFGLASQAMGIWMGMATSTLQASQRLFAAGGQQPQQPPAPAEPERSAGPAVLTLLEGGAARRAAQPVERTAPAGTTGQEASPQNGSPAKARAKVIQNAANSAAALGDPEAGKDFARKAEAKVAKPVAAEGQKRKAETSKPREADASNHQAAQKSEPAAAEKSRLKAAETTEPQGQQKAKSAPAKQGKAKAHEPAADSPAPAQQARQPKAADRPETPDNLKAISGIGPKLEKVLNGLGIWTYAQLAGLAQEEIAWLEDHLGFGGRIGRDDWLGQAKALVPTKQ